MTTTEPGVSAMRAVTISREYGSGGGEIAARLAERIGWRLVDHEVITQIAQLLGVDEEDAEAHDEHVESWVLQLFSTMQTVGPMVAIPTNLSFPPNDAAYTHAVREVVMGAVLMGQCVIVGRGAQMILHDRRDTLHVRIIAPLDQRVAYVAQRENLAPAAAQQHIQQMDLDRRRYLSVTYRHTPDEAHLYDIIINTGALDLDTCVRVIQSALDAKAASLALPGAPLGPSAHLPPYPHRPENATATNSTAGVIPGAGEGGVTSNESGT